MWILIMGRVNINHCKQNDNKHAELGSQSSHIRYTHCRINQGFLWLTIVRHMFRQQLASDWLGFLTATTICLYLYYSLEWRRGRHTPAEPPTTIVDHTAFPSDDIVSCGNLSCFCNTYNFCLLLFYSFNSRCTDWVLSSSTRKNRSFGLRYASWRSGLLGIRGTNSSSCMPTKHHPVTTTAGYDLNLTRVRDGHFGNAKSQTHLCQMAPRFVIICFATIFSAIPLCDHKVT